MTREAEGRDGYWLTREFPRAPGDRPLLDGWSITVCRPCSDVAGRSAFRIRFMPGDVWCQITVIPDSSGNRRLPANDLSN